MSVRIRLQRFGAKKRPFYRVVATDKRAPRDGRFIELLGTFDPLQDPPVIRLRRDRIDYWLSVGAVPSQTTKTLIRKLSEGEAIDLSDNKADLEAKKARLERKRQLIEANRQATLEKHKEAEAAAIAAAEAEAKAAEEEAKAKAEAEAKAAAALLDVPPDTETEETTSESDAETNDATSTEEA